MNKVTKVTFTFPNGNTKEFNAVGFVGAFTLSHEETFEGRVSQIGGFATGQFTKDTVIALARSVLLALAKEMADQGISEQQAQDILLKIVPSAVKSAQLIPVDAKIDQLEKGPNIVEDAIQQLLNMR
jgi:hypothetical protein